MKNSVLKHIAVIAMLVAGALAVRAADWKDPGQKLDRVDFKESRLADAVTYLHERFKGEIDMVVPPQVADVTVSLHLKNATATEAFNAMNQLFDADQSPVRWALDMNGTRPTAVLRVLETLHSELKPAADWKAPSQIMEQIEFQDAKIIDVADFIRKALKEEVDVLVPAQCGAVTVSLSFRNLTAKEAFNAMNKLFEAGQQPVRWVLTMNGPRPTAVLRIVGAPVLVRDRRGDSRTVIYVGDLVGAEGLGFLPDVVRAIHETYRLAFPSSSIDIKVHDATQLMVVTGPPDDLKFVRETVEALKQKVTAERQRKAAPPVAPAKP